MLRNQTKYTYHTQNIWECSAYSWYHMSQHVLINATTSTIVYFLLSLVIGSCCLQSTQDPLLKNICLNVFWMCWQPALSLLLSLSDAMSFILFFSVSALSSIRGALPVPSLCSSSLYSSVHSIPHFSPPTASFFSLCSSPSLPHLCLSSYHVIVFIRKECSQLVWNIHTCLPLLSCLPVLFLALYELSWAMRATLKLWHSEVLKQHFR